MKQIDWSSLSFGYMKTDYNVRCWYRDGAWGEIEISSEETLNIHMAATNFNFTPCTVAIPATYIVVSLHITERQT